MTESEAVRRLHALPPVGSRVLVTYNADGKKIRSRNGIVLDYLEGWY